MFFVTGAAILFGLVATLAKISMDQVVDLERGGPPTVATILPLALSVVGLTTAAVYGSALVQRAYRKSTPDLVVAGLTVIDPLVAVAVGTLILHESSDPPWWAVLVALIASASAILGVCRLAAARPGAQ